ncbi:MAG: hypothetical protein L6Q98_16310 [Anaerolineae bacterium]|nr:hypothetical protein [Anaerolineae bacterium]NUQ04242.1 hypothetical protein [Anaerolineae bacterium]
MDSHGHPSRQPVAFGLALTAGGGLVLIIIALALGVVNNAAVEGGAVGYLFVAGLLLLIVGIVTWAAVVRPFEHFDDINEPKDSGHGHGAHEAHGEDLLLPEGMQQSLPSGEGKAALPAAGGHAH